jgi:hypothetical protein
MKSFKDTAGRTWLVQVNVGTIKRVRDLLGVDLLAIVEDGAKLLRDLADDPVRLVDVLYAVLKPQADAATPYVNDEQFGEAMFGDPIAAGFEALVEAVTDFFPQARQRKALTTLMGKFWLTANLILDQSQTAIESIDPVAIVQAAQEKAQAAQEKAGAKHSKPRTKSETTSGAAPDSAESTPTA